MREARRRFLALEALEGRALLAADLLIDLNGSDQAGTDFSAAFTEDAGPVLAQDSDAAISNGAAGFGRLGGEFRVNTTISGNQELFGWTGGQAVAADSAGNFVVTWSSPDGDGWGVYAQRYAANGSPVGGEFQVNTYASFDQIYSSVAMDNAGNFVVTWSSPDSSGYGVYARRFAANGSPVGDEFQVNSYVLSNQLYSSVAMDDAGNFVVTWSSLLQDSSSWGVYARRYAANGSSLGGEFQVNTYFSSDQLYPSVAMDDAGNFVFTWQSYQQDANGWGVYARRYAANGSPLGSEFQVNTYNYYDQSYPAVAMDDAGNFVVTWSSSNQDGSGWGVYARRYASNGLPVTGEFLVNTTIASSQIYSSVAMDDAGSFVVTWQSYQQYASAGDVYARRYTANGSALGGEFQVNTYNDSEQYTPSVAMDGAGNFVVTWSSYLQDGSGSGVFAQRYSSGFDTAGVSGGTEFGVNTTTVSHQESPSWTGAQAVATDDAGNFVVTWSSVYQDGSGWGVYARRYASNGSPITGEFLVNTTTVDSQIYSSVAMDGAGRFVVTWSSLNQDGSGWGVYARCYDADGSPVGGEFQVNTYFSSDQLYPSVAMDDAGKFVVTWQSVGQDGSGWGVYARRYAVNGSPITAEFQVNSYVSDDQVYPSVTMDNAGSFVITWSSNRQDGDAYGVYARRYAADGSPMTGEFQVNTTTFLYQIDASAAMDDAGNFVVTWSSLNQDGSGYGVYARRYAADGSPVGGEVQINTYVRNGQDYSSVAMDHSGNFVVTWSSYLQDGSDWGVYARTYASDGSPVGDEFQVNTYVSSDQLYPSVAMDDAGKFVISWQSAGQDGSGWGVYARQFKLNDHIEQATVTLTNPLDGLAESLSADVSGTTLSWAWNGSSGILTISGLASRSDYQKVLRTISYNNSSQDPTTADRILEFAVSSSNGRSPVAKTTISITGVNDAPAVAAAISRVESEDAAGFTVNLLSGASDPDASDVLSVSGLTLISGDASGVSQSGNSLSLDPSAYNYLAVGESAVISYSYSVIDGNGGTVAQSATITITGLNDGPAVAGSIGQLASEDAAGFTVDLLSGASDPDASDVLSVSGLTLISGDALGVSQSGNSLSIDPSAYNYLAVGESAVISYSYSVIDGNGSSVAQSATITITGLNDGPAVAGAIGQLASEDAAGFTVDLLSGASDPDASDVLSVSSLTLISGDASGVSQSGNSLSIDPSAYNYLAVGESAVISYSYSVIDGNGGSVAQSATITITGVNDGPAVAGAIGQLASEDAASFTVDLLSGASDPDTSDVLSVSGLTLISGDASGVTISGNSLSIDPSAYNYLAVGESAVISYSYSVIDGNGGSVAQSATITTTGVNDGPAVTAAISRVESEDAASFTVDLLSSASDPDASDVLSVSGLTLISGDASGVTISGNTLSIDPSAYNYLAVGENAVISYSYSIIDGNGGSIAQSATITITGVNDGPAVAAAISRVESEDAAGFTVDLLSGASDPDASDVLSVSGLTLISGDSSGVTISGNTLSIDPSAYSYLAVGESAVISYSYSVIDGNGGSAAQSATITITGVNDGPAVAGAISQLASEDALGFPVDLLSGASDPDTSDVLSVSGLTLISGDASGVSVSGNSLSIDPSAYNYLAAGESAVISYSYTVIDGNGGSIAQSATITITGVNDGPVASDNQYAVAEDGVLEVAAAGLLADDSDIDITNVLRVVTVNGASAAVGASVGLAHGTLTLQADGSFSYAPSGVCDTAGEVETFSYTISDGNGGTATASVTIAISPTVAAGETSFIDGIFRLSGTSGNDTIVLRNVGGVLYRNGVSTGIAIANLAEIRVWGRGGNDTIDMDGIKVNSYLHGGAGDDTLIGGSARDLIFGGLGSDSLTGSAGHDLLIGGSGSDRSVGAAGNDILVAGELACSTTRKDLDELLDAWSDQAEGTEGEAVNEVFADDDFDMLTGSSGADWFIVSSGDKITDLKKRNTDGDAVTLI